MFLMCKYVSQDKNRRGFLITVRTTVEHRRIRCRLVLKEFGDENGGYILRNCIQVTFWLIEEFTGVIL